MRLAGWNMVRTKWGHSSMGCGCLSTSCKCVPEGLGYPAKKVSSAVGLSPHKMSTGVERWHKGKNVQGIRTASRLGLAVALILGRKADAEIRGAVVTSLHSHGKRKIE